MRPLRAHKIAMRKEYVASSDDDDDGVFGSEGERGVEEEEEKEEGIDETPAEKRKRLADALLEQIRTKLRKIEEEDEFESDGEVRREREWERDSLIAEHLQQTQLEESGHVRRAIASRVQIPEGAEGFHFIVKHGQPVTAIALSEDDSKGFSASKDGSIVHWDVISGKHQKYLWPNEEVLKSHGVRDPQGGATKHSKQTLALAVSSDDRYLATGGLDRHVHLWDTRTRQHIHAFPGHKELVSCLTFRQGTPELFSGSFDGLVKIWNAEDRTYISMLCGHVSDVLTIDSLRKERVLTVGRDRTMLLHKVPEEARLTYRASSFALECGCFVSNDEFLSGCDDGSIAYWNVIRKKPVHIVRNAHASFNEQKCEQRNTQVLSNGCIENGDRYSSRLGSSALSWVNSITVCRGSDLAASGAGNGAVRLWAIQSESRRIQPSFELPLVGFVNSLAFAKSGKFLVAGVGQEPRLGRWARVSAATNGVAIHALELS